MLQHRQLRICASYMRGGTSKGVLISQQDLPTFAQEAGTLQDQLLLRMLGSPDPYEKQIDGMGGATSSTSKVALISKSHRPEHDVDYLFGQVSIQQETIDWSGNCGNLTAAVGLYAIQNGLVVPNVKSNQETVAVRIWQANINKTIVAHIPIINGQALECGNFALDGVAFTSPEIKIEFIEPVNKNEQLFPTGQLSEILDVPSIGSFTVTMINAGIPTAFIHASELGYTGIESQLDINNDVEALVKLETIRAYAAQKMGLIKTIEQAKVQQHTPKLALIAPSQTYVSSSGKTIELDDIDLNVRAMSMGKLHHAMMGTAAVAIATASAVKGTIVNQLIKKEKVDSVTFGHPSGLLTVGALVNQTGNDYVVQKVTMSRSARTIMDGHVCVPWHA